MSRGNGAARTGAGREDGSSSLRDGPVRNGQSRLEERIPSEAGVPLAAVRIEDPDGGPAARRTEPAPGDDDVRPLPDDVPPEPDPRPPHELEAEAGGALERLSQRRRQAGRLQDDEHRAGSPSERPEAPQAIRDGGRAPRDGILPGSRDGPPMLPLHGAPTVLPRACPNVGEVHEEEVHRPALDERTGHRQAVLDRIRGEDDEPFEPDAARDGLDRIEAAGEVEVGHDRAAGLGFRREAKGEGGLAAREVPPNGDARLPGNATRADDRVERGEPGGHDAAVIRPPERLRCRERLRRLRERPVLVRQGDGRKRADDLADMPRSCRSPARPERSEGFGQIGGGGRHGPLILEHLF